MAGLTGLPSDIAKAIDPRIVLTRDRQVMLFLTLATGLVTGLGAALVAGLDKTRWTSYTLSRGRLAFRR
jgi:hypothetical protein